MKAIIINGPMGVGKTTVGTHIANRHPGTAFIDGDWCLDLHPFVGNDETKSMAIDNILHMAGNYKKCSACRMIVLVWLMDDRRVHEKIIDGLTRLGLEVIDVTLTCSEKQLIQRWKSDTICPWRTDEWLQVSLKSLPYFASLSNCIDTTALTVEEAAARICP